jgi:hypothetical protein
MNDYMFDGKPHVLDKNTGYISVKFEETLSFFEVDCIKTNLIKEYIKYLIKYDPDKCIEILLPNFLYNFHDKDFSLVHKPAWITSMLAQNATLSIKFKRAQKDGLDEEKINL